MCPHEVAKYPVKQLCSCSLVHSLVSAGKRRSHLRLRPIVSRTLQKIKIRYRMKVPFNMNSTGKKNP